MLIYVQKRKKVDFKIRSLYLKIHVFTCFFCISLTHFPFHFFVDWGRLNSVHYA